jgi:SAM-dependent methyltransferase
MDRKEKLRNGLDIRNLAGMEIGPLDRPTILKSEGEVIYVDHTDAKSLREKYAAASDVNPSCIVDVDRVWGEQTLSECLGSYRQRDYVIASHVIEHVPDMISWLEEIESVLSPGGELRLVVPDRRFTFDYLRQETRLCDVLNAYLVRARAPLPIAILDHFIGFRQVDLAAAWNGTLDAANLPTVPGYDAESGMRIAQDAIKDGTYYDVHSWIFTPHSFAQLLQETAEIGLHNFSCEGFYDTEPGQLEFVVVLRVNTDKTSIVESWRSLAKSVCDNLPGSTDGRQSAVLQALQRAKTLARQLEAAQELIARQEAAIRATQQQIAAIEVSNSWKLTQPLRSIRKLIRGA